MVKKEITTVRGILSAVWYSEGDQEITPMKDSLFQNGKSFGHFAREPHFRYPIYGVSYLLKEGYIDEQTAEAIREKFMKRTADAFKRFQDHEEELSKGDAPPQGHDETEFTTKIDTEFLKPGLEKQTNQSRPSLKEIQKKHRKGHGHDFYGIPLLIRYGLALLARIKLR